MDTRLGRRPTGEGREVIPDPRSAFQLEENVPKPPRLGTGSGMTLKILLRRDL
jgi:hypothetical protein